MPLRRLPVLLLLALAFALLGAAPALAGGLARIDGDTLLYVGDGVEPNNVTISDADGQLTIDENASRITPGDGCSATGSDYEVTCPDANVEHIHVQLSDMGSDVRIKADIPSQIEGGAGDDLLIGGPADDVIDGGRGEDIIGGGAGADKLNGGPGQDLVTYADQIRSRGTLNPRRGGIVAAIGKDGASGARREGDTIGSDVEELQGGAGNDRFRLRDRRKTSVACGAGHDTVTADPRDDEDIDCESASVAAAAGQPKPKLPTLAYPFVGIADVGRGRVTERPVFRLRKGAVLLRVTCPPGVGLLELVPSMGCRGYVRFARGKVSMGARRVNVPHGKTITLRLPLTSSRAFARRPQGLTMTATAQPYRGKVRRTLKFTVKG